MDPINPNPNPPSMRVLTPPPVPVPASPPNPIPPSQPQHHQQPLPPRQPEDGVVVVGFISRSPDDSSQLINRILDANVFGSGRLDKGMFVDNEELRDWFKWRRIGYYHEEEKGVLFLQLCSIRCAVGFSGPGPGFDREEREFEDLQGLLFMFSVCHLIIYIQEGSCINTHILQKFRVLQAAKHALAPYIRSKTTSSLLSRPHSFLSSSRPTSSTSTSPRRNGGLLNRNASAVSLMSGMGPNTSLFPGYCTPVTLFVFIDDFLEVPNSSFNVEEPIDAASFSQSSSLNASARPNLPTMSSGSVVVLARPVCKSEGGFRKKLQSSLEAQIRFLIKKCRILASSESGHTVARNGNISSSAPLFLLDASRAVMLLERSTNQRGESLEFAIHLVDDVLSGKASSDSFLLESHCQSANKEDILSIKEFIYRQSDILRGRGGLFASSNSGSAVGGVGMVAVAAAAAAASAASGKTLTTSNLPSLETWLSSSQLILNRILSAKCGSINETEFGRRKPSQRSTGGTQTEGVASRGIDTIDIAVSLLGNGRGLNTKFSTLWCERVLPTAKDVYLKDLPAFYPTSQHEAHLEKALRAFHSMVRGPAVQLFAKKLEDECISIWKSGRQLCDTVSLTGKSCMHQRHDVDNVGTQLTEAAVKQHSSGYFFLHSCACGRSRQLRPDSFNFESANITSNNFLDCDKQLPTVQLPEASNAGPVKSTSWSLIRVGGARYYEPSKGLLLSGFSTTHKFLLKYAIFLEKLTNANGLPAIIAKQSSVTRSWADSQVELNQMDRKKTGATQSYTEIKETEVETLRKPPENSKLDDKKISFGKGLSNFTMRRPFSEVVAGSSSTDSGFPPLQQRKQLPLGSEEGNKQNIGRVQSAEQIQVTTDQGSTKSRDITSVLDPLNGLASNGSTDGPTEPPFLRIGSNVVPMNVDSGDIIKLNPTLKLAIAYIGFEHECPYGHRFLLNLDHLNELGSEYSWSEESLVASAETSTSNHNQADSSKLSRNSGHGKIHRNLKGITASAANKPRNKNKSKEIRANSNLRINGLIQVSGSGKNQNQPSFSPTTNAELVKNLDADLKPVSLDDGGSALSMLNRNLPIYMHCPYCRFSKTKQDPENVKFAGTISQLQRIFLVTPPFPLVLATCPVVQFEASHLPQPSVVDHERKLQFSLGCQVVLPPESFLTLRLPFVYGIQLEDGSLHPLNALEHQPELTAWIMKGTTLQVISKGDDLDGGHKT